MLKAPKHLIVLFLVFPLVVGIIKKFSFLFLKTPSSLILPICIVLYVFLFLFMPGSRYPSAIMTLSELRPPAYEAIKSPREEVQEVYDQGDLQHPLLVKSPNSFYKDAYTHGYYEGYIKGFEAPEVPKPPQQIPIAITGMSTRLPGNVTTPDEFWELCSRARNIWSEVPKERFNQSTFHHPNPGKSGTFNAKGGYFLKEDVGLFDAPFFSLTAQEATSMDPQQRILLECAFEALESAGIPKHEIVGQDIGVFIGGSFSEYESQLFADTETNPMYQSTGMSSFCKHIFEY